ncbi:1-deoxy-D-xylulose 5-phosphate reductoisomerase [Campylobacter blaseri]|uniref:1-deoxy-D-xylulose 5-phosphate reductoisomerase n=1 Tax=Campylobacter blaseri TaxID=2042961 RepID=A0A2P8R3W6_9BACT|nr:1-deoxy-D-xylulose-5-phosphate reductoisomerase [Campylobacter blaseri]PSM53204.1 1-deoxy-D-xylulose-5-phosphate reductoisomerase [Campylobacter blaseri]PSM54670.1 1-deoxy-D-xylulose-5-phosphate reductoisomerase [Campylobacter blaseri]QKF86853.1 1-deoxy-D-xylulose 5-phosphate reductoisomerase [Campylobacter blaseri]
MVVLGSTGSIGVNSLEIAKRFNLEIEALSCNKNYKLLNEQISKFSPKFVCIGDKFLKDKVNHNKVFIGENGLLDMLKECQSSKVVNALVGFAGLKPSILVQKLGKTLCLANKESLVAGGKFLDSKKIKAIDSEHFGLKFLLKDSLKIKKMIITASGGAFRDTPLGELKNATPQMALKHPNWKMGSKITIDSATMTNKLFEIMEAYWLYGVKNLDAIIEKSSTIHALIDFIDGSTTAHISIADMKLAISHAIIDDLNEEIVSNFDLLNLKKMEFQKIDLEKFPIFSLKDEVVKNPDLGTIINAANEIYVKKFLNNECKFLDNKKIVFESLDKFGSTKITDIDDLFELDFKVKEFALHI